MGSPLFTRRSDAELLDAIQAVFNRWDVDRSGLLSLDEFREGVGREAASPQFRDDPTVRLVASAVAAAASPELPRLPERNGP